MSTVKANAYLDASGGNNATINGIIPGEASTPFQTWGNATFIASSTLTIPADKQYIILACGGGGSGATVNSGSVNTDTKALGGNGGSVVLLSGTTSSSTVLTITIGGGGAAKTSGTGSGNAGSATTVVGTGINISASGGSAGTQTGTAAIASTPNAASSGGTVYECGLWNVGTHTDGNISFSGTAPFGGGGTTAGSTTTGMSGSNDAFNANEIGESMAAYNVFTYDQTALIWPLMAQANAVNIGSFTVPNLPSQIAGGAAGDASSPADGQPGAYGGGGGGGAAASGMSSGAGGSGWVTIWVEK